MAVRNLAEGFQDYEGWISDPRPRISFGIPFFDDATNGGIARSEIAMMMAFSSVGKTTLALNIIANNPDVPVLFFSLEMNWRMVAARLAAITSGMSTKEIENHYRAGSRPGVVQKTVDTYRKLVCDDTPAITLKDSKDSFRLATEKLGEPPRLVIWDYLELIGGSGLMGKSEQVDRASEKLRNWTREHDCASLVLHQVGKGDAGGGSKPLDLGSGRYGGHAPMDFVLGAYAERLNADISPDRRRAVQDEVHLQLLKNRAGMAHPDGVRHRLDHLTMRLTDWHALPPAPFMLPRSMFDDEREVLGV